jgi:hypothetical protein
MNLNPAELLSPVFNALDSLIENEGVYLYLGFVWLALLAVAWIFSGGLRRKQQHGNFTTVIPPSSSWRNYRGNRNHQSLTSRLSRHGTITD